jgi:hypothetical protein
MTLWLQKAESLGEKATERKQKIKTQYEKIRITLLLQLLLI